MKNLSRLSCCVLLLALTSCDNTTVPVNLPESNTSAVKVLETYLQALTPEDETLNTRFGKVRITRSQADMPLDSVMFDDKTVFHQEGFYLSLHYYIKQNERDMVLFSSNCGGTACLHHQFYFLLLADAHEPMVVTRNEFLAIPEDLALNVEGERLIIDLGFQSSKHKTAVLQGQQLAIQLDTVPKSFVGEENCRWLYEEALRACKDYQETDASCREPENNFLGYLSRGVAAVGEHPGFVSEAFARRCKIACESTKMVDYPTFAKEVCSKP